MNRNAVLGAGLAALVVLAILAFTGGKQAAPAPAQAPVQQAPLPTLDGVTEKPAGSGSPASAAPSHH